MYIIFGFLSALLSLLFLLFNPLKGDPELYHLSHALIIGHWATLLFHTPVYFISMFKRNHPFGLFILLGATATFLYNNLWVVITQPVSIYFILFSIMATFSIFVLIKIIKEIKLNKIEVQSKKSHGIYLIIISVIFYILWTLQIVSFLKTGIPMRHTEYWGTPTSPVHILDMILFLPFLFTIGFNILKHRTYGGYFITGVTMFVIIGAGLLIDRIVLFINNDYSRFGSFIFLFSILLIGIIKTAKIGVKYE